jgi:hypothetical protein
MSRRFGRNQRRRAREALAAAQIEAARMECAYRTADALSSMLVELVDDLTAELDEAKGMAHGLSILFPARSQTLPEETGKSVRRGYHVTVPGMLPLSSIEVDERALVDMEPLRLVRLPVLLTRIHEDVLHNRVHVRVAFNDGSGETGYAIDPREFHQYPRDVMVKRVHKIIAPAIAAHLVHQFYKKG